MKLLAAAALVLALPGPQAPARAQVQADPTGTWRWTIAFGERTREVTLQLKLDGDKLTGALLGPRGREIPIQDPSYKGGQVSFKVSRSRRGQTFTSTYTGKVSGDTITGKIESERGGRTRSRDWEAKRIKP
jgi:hypothetical protein